MTQTAKLTVSDGAAGDHFGNSVAISFSPGSYTIGAAVVVVGAPDQAIGANAGQGSAYVFMNPETGWADMTQTAKLTVSDGAAGDHFGNSVAISFSPGIYTTGTDTVVVGAPDQAIGANAGQGSAYVFMNPGTGWTQTAKLTAADGSAGDHFGNSVAISFSLVADSDVVVVGAPDDTIGANAGQGSAYVFVEPATGWADTTQTAKLTASDGAAFDSFGNSVALNGNDVAVGAPGCIIGGNANEGSAYVYHYEQSGGDGGGEEGGGGTEGGGFKFHNFNCFISSAGNGVTITRDRALFFLLLVGAVLTAAIRRNRP
jgi:hypothetical protein